MDMISPSWPFAKVRDGASVPVPVEVGESVKFKDYAGADIRLDGEDYIVVRVPDCLAKWTE